MSVSVPISRTTSAKNHPDALRAVPTLRTAELPHSLSEPRHLEHQVLIADRDPMSSDLLAHAVASDRNCDASPIRSSDLMQRLKMRAAEIIVIGADQEYRSGNGLDLASEVARIYPDTMIVIILNQPTHALIVQAFRCGARGVISRHQPISEFLSCIEHVSRGFIWAGREETTSLLQAFKSIPSPLVLSSSSSLTARELQVVQCAAAGKTNKAIAADLNLSEHTVKNYLFRAFEKIGVSSRIELLFYLTMHGHIVSSVPARKLD